MCCILLLNAQDSDLKFESFIIIKPTQRTQNANKTDSTKT